MRDWLGLVLGCGLVGLGCGPKVDAGDEGGSGASTGVESSSTLGSGEPNPTTAPPDPSAPEPEPLTTANPSEPEPVTVTVTSGDSSGIIVDDFGSGGSLPHGSECDDDGQCVSGHCYVLGVLGGICGECSADMDCPDGGCTLPNPLSDPPQGAVCNTGQLGDNCMSDDVCAMNLTCATVMEVPGVVSVISCSECEVDADCAPGLLCNPWYDIVNLQGVKTCVPQGSVMPGEGCDFMTTGDLACDTGFCEPADVMGLLQLGVCSSCSSDDQCPAEQMCLAPEVSLTEGLIAGACG